MKLKQKLESMPKEEAVCIGSRSAYLFIGSAEKALSELDSISQWYLDIFTKYAETYGNLAQAERYRKIVDDFVPILQREVKDSYKRINGDLAVIVEGEEGGKYWFQFECEELHNERGRRSKNEIYSEKRKRKQLEEVIRIA